VRILLSITEATQGLGEGIGANCTRAADMAQCAVSFGVGAGACLNQGICGLRGIAFPSKLKLKLKRQRFERLTRPVAALETLAPLTDVVRHHLPLLCQFTALQPCFPCLDNL